MKMVYKYFVLLGLIIVARWGYTQPNASVFLYGYIVITNGNTIKGKVKPSLENIKFIKNDTKKTKIYPNQDITAYKYGRHIYQNINGFYRIAINGPVRMYIKEVIVYRQKDIYVISYYGVKRSNEEKVTIIGEAEKKRVAFQNEHLFKNIFKDYVPTEITDIVAISQDILISKDYMSLTEYFKDCPPILKALEEGNYNKLGSIHNIVDRYNRYILLGK